MKFADVALCYGLSRFNFVSLENFTDTVGERNISWMNRIEKKMGVFADVFPKLLAYAFCKTGAVGQVMWRWFAQPY